MEKKSVTFRSDPRVHRDCKKLAKRLEVKLGKLIEDGMRLMLARHSGEVIIKQ
jgi:hypothetical protein